MSRYAVVGQPVAHSKSPLIHALFAQQCGQELVYDRQEVPPEAFADFVHEFFAAGGNGLNVTLPHKEAAFALCEEVTPRAKLAGAVNTLSYAHGRLCGDNTDGPGMLRDISVNHDFDITGKSILMLGAGGAARGALAALVEAGPASITLLNRTLAKAEAIRTAFCSVWDISVADFESAVPDQSYDLIINATSLSLEGKLPRLSDNWVHAGSCCYDMMYAESATVFQRWAMEHNAALALDGLGMLVEQAAESFLIWRGIRPETAPVIVQLRGR